MAKKREHRIRFVIAHLPMDERLFTNTSYGGSLVSTEKNHGGEGGIRTHGRVSPTHAFQACSLNRSDTSPFQSNQCNRSVRVAETVAFDCVLSLSYYYQQ